ncbi:FG-GAP repeat domain-containing protein [Occallatibacter riparius]|uniref:VCBS repeat-containing protein n=1 Tax=Occallatibacter riparius TaxID=1002689 RepID=A0A9J7BQ41_9BACT|nr:VCBS repeat-containing protein [Occallatibacter riparius]UWZ84996.1 VCBS repeat-containing protein [Occallatibacter riparius]
MHLRFVASAAAFALLSALPALAQTPSFQTTAYQNNLSGSSYGLNGHITADLNGDGLDDFISAVSPSFDAGCTGSFAVTLSKGDGTYAAPVCYDVPSGDAIAFAAADFNRTGNISLIVGTGQGVFYWFMNTGVGVLQYRGVAAGISSAPAGLIAADFNHDGNPDLATIIPGPTSTNVNDLVVFDGNGDGTFSTGPYLYFTLKQPQDIQLGDFDNDNNTDIAVHGYNGSLVLYGDGHSAFSKGTLVGGSPIAYRAVDLSSNGATDLIGTPLPTTSGRGPTTYFKHLDIQYGRTNRTFNEQYVYLKSCTPDYTPPSVADVNGDGINDIIVIEASDCQGNAPWSVNVLPGKGDGTYGPEQVIYQLGTVAFFETHVIRANRDTKPDLMFFQQSPIGPFQDLAQNTTTGNFPKCNPPLYGYDIEVCAPTATTGAASPVTFSFGASNNSLARDIEVWVDGNKIADQLKQAFSNYNFVDTTATLAAGQHHVDVYAKAWDSEVRSTSFDLTVGSNVCPKNGENINICSPILHSTLPSTVTAYARGTGDPSGITRMELWVDGAKRYSTYASDTLKTQVILTPGIHTFTYYEVMASGQILRRDVQASVE